MTEPDLAMPIDAPRLWPRSQIVACGREIERDIADFKRIYGDLK